MPELPEVETVANSVRKHILNKSFESIHLNWKKTLENFTIDRFNVKAKNNPVIDVYRRGKYIIIAFDDCILAVHLRMTGKLYVVEELDVNKKHISLYLKFSNKYLLFEDTRKFGRFYLYRNINYLDEKLGVEPLSDEFSEDWLLNNIKNRSRQIKPLLLDQSFIAGIGNIYADEALWYASIHPLSISSNLSKRKIKILREGIIKVLSESIKLGGTTIRDYTYDFSYVGSYAINLNVFGKEGHNCSRCNTIIIKNKVAQRGTHFCPKCQKK